MPSKAEMNGCFPEAVGQDAFEAAKKYVSLHQKALKRSAATSEMGMLSAAASADAANSKLQTPEANCKRGSETVLGPKNWAMSDPDYVVKSCSSEGLETMKATQLAEFSSGAKKLSFLGVQHSYYFNNAPMGKAKQEQLFSEVEELLTKSNPGLLLVEGLPTEWGPMPCEMLSAVLKPNSENHRNEMSKALLKSFQSGIPFIGWEPSDEDLISSLDAQPTIVTGKKKYTGKDMAFYRLHEILTQEYFQPLSQQHGNFATMEGLKKTFREQCTRGLPNIMVAAFGKDWRKTFDPKMCTDASLAPLLKDYQNHFHNWTGLNLLKINLSQGIPTTFMPASLEELKNSLRDGHLRLLARESLERYDHTMVIGGNFSTDPNGKKGCGHLSQNYRVFERNFERPAPQQSEEGGEKDERKTRDPKRVSKSEK
jgi:hypothetical protein